MTTATELKKQINRRYVDVYLKRRYPDGSFDSDWIDISRYVLDSGFDTVKYKLDSGDFDVGIFVTNNVGLKLNNSTGKFNDSSDCRSYWGMLDERHLSKIKIEAGYIDDTDTKLDEIVFQGIIDERSMTTYDDDSIDMTALSIDSVFSSVSVITGSLSSTVSASTAIYTLCSRSEITDYMTVDLTNINPDNDINLDSPDEFDGQKLDQVLNEIALITNSVIFIDSSNNLIVKSRDRSPDLKYNFYLNSETGKTSNIYKIKNFNSGRHRVKNYWVWSGSSVSASSSSTYLKKFGTTRKAVSSSSVTNSSVQQSVLNNLLSSWQYPKKELMIETDYLANELTFFDTVQLDVRPSLSRHTDLPICGSAVCGTAQCVTYTTGIKISELLGFKVLSIEHDLINSKTILKLREIGSGLNDGYLPMYLSKVISVSFSASTSETITTSTYGINAQRAMVEVLNSSSDYVTEELTITRPTTGTIVLTAGTAITETFSVLVAEVTA